MAWPILRNARKLTWFRGPDKGNGAEIGDETSGAIEVQTEMGDNGGGEEQRDTGYNRDKPPDDDCCPICFGDFTVPCRTNCGHWFCGSCILQLWKYRSWPSQCKCPFCSCGIHKLVAEVSAVDNIEAEVEVFANVEQYNHLYAEGINGFFVQILAFYLRKHGPYLHLYLLQALVVAVISPLIFIKNLLVDPIRHPERVMLNFVRAWAAMTVMIFIVVLYCSVFQPGPPLTQKLINFTMWINYVCFGIVFLPFFVRRELIALLEHKAARRAQGGGFRAEEAALDENDVLLQNIAAVEVARQEPDTRALTEPTAS